MKNDKIMERYIVVGVTGPTGSGKSTLRLLADELGCVWLDCDLIAREIVEPEQPALRELAAHFGSDIIGQDGTLDRARLAQLAFPTREGRDALNAITHPRVLERLRELMRSAFENGKHAVIDAPLLFEGGVDSLCDSVVAVLASPEKRLQRIMRRDGINEEGAWLRMNAQPADDFYIERAAHILYNNSSSEQLLTEARALFVSLLAGNL